MVEKASSMPLSKCQRCPECSTASILGCRELVLHVSKPTDPMFHVFSHLKRESHEEGLRNPFYPYVARRLKAPGLLSFTVFEDYRVPRCSKYPSFKLASKFFRIALQEFARFYFLCLEASGHPIFHHWTIVQGSRATRQLGSGPVSFSWKHIVHHHPPMMLRNCW